MRLAVVPFLALIGLAAAVAARHSAPPQGASTRAAAAMFRGDAAHTGVYRGLAGASFAGIAWRFPTGGEIISSPAVAGGVVYVGSGDGGVYAIDLRTGAQRWRFDASAPVHSSPAVSGGLVFFGCRDRDNRFMAVDAASGRLVWSRATGPDVALPWGHESGDYYVSSPAVSGGTVVFGSGDGHVYAVDARTGAIRWRHRTGGRVRSSPAISGGTVFAGATDGCLYALDLATGAERWRAETEGHGLHSEEFGYDRRSIQSSPAVAGGSVFVGARDGFLYAFDASTGARRWRFDHHISWVITSPAVDDSTVYAASSDARFVQGVNARTGAERWRYDTRNIVWSSPAVAGGRVYAADRSGVLYALDTNAGTLAWEYTGEGAFSASPVVSDSLIVVGRLDGSVEAIRTTSGPALARAVYWDDSLAVQSWTENKDMRDRLAEKGYAVLDTTKLLAFLEAHVRDRAPSVVVCALDALPAGAGNAADLAHALLRRYLDAGGRVVWPGVPPLLWPRPRGDMPSDFLRRCDRDVPGALLGVDFSASNFDLWGAHTFERGRAWGMPPLWRAGWAVNPASVTEVLARDESGLASAWIKTYGPLGGAFVRPWDGRVSDPPAGVAQLAAEHRPLGGFGAR